MLKGRCGCWFPEQAGGIQRTLGWDPTPGVQAEWFAGSETSGNRTPSGASVWPSVKWGQYLLLYPSLPPSLSFLHPFVYLFIPGERMWTQPLTPLTPQSSQPNEDTRYWNNESCQITNGGIICFEGRGRAPMRAKGRQPSLRVQGNAVPFLRSQCLSWWLEKG